MESIQRTVQKLAGIYCVYMPVDGFAFAMGNWMFNGVFRFIANNCRAQILVVEDEKQLDKILTVSAMLSLVIVLSKFVL